MASFHLSVKTVQRSAGRSATAAAAYRHACRIECDREGRVHDYRAKQGVDDSFILAPEGAPAWAQDRAALWNAAEARDTRVNSVTAREWELALPAELDAGGRRLLVAGFAAELVGRYGVVADVAIHAPHREGDHRNWHAHVLTTTRALGPEGLTDKTRVLDAKQTGGPEIALMRERWAEMQNHALERQGLAERVDHRSLAVQRERALAHGDERAAEQLDRAPEAKLGPVVNAVERREQRAADREGQAYVPVTERGAQVHEARQARSLLAELVRLRDALREEVRERAEAARETYAHAREEGAHTIKAGLAALRAAAHRQGIGLEPQHGPTHRAGLDHGALDRALGRGQGDEQGRDAWPEREAREASRASIKERLGRIMGREAARHAQEGPKHGPAEASQPAHVPDRLDRQALEHRERSLGREAIRERLEALRDRARPAAERVAGPVAEQVAERAAQQEGEEVAARLLAHRQGMETMREVRAQAERHLREVGIMGLDATRERLGSALDRARPVVVDREGPVHEGGHHQVQRDGPERVPMHATAERQHGPVAARVVERAHDEPAWAPSFRTPQEGQAFREEMERRFDPDTLARLGRGEEQALAAVTDNRLDGLYLARAWLDSGGAIERSPVRMSLADKISDAWFDAKREREAHQEMGHSWGL